MRTSPYFIYMHCLFIILTGKVQSAPQTPVLKLLVLSKLLLLLLHMWPNQKMLAMRTATFDLLQLLNSWSSLARWLSLYALPSFGWNASNPTQLLQAREMPTLWMFSWWPLYTPKHQRLDVPKRTSALLSGSLKIYSCKTNKHDNRCLVVMVSKTGTVICKHKKCKQSRAIIASFLFNW